MHRTKQLGEYVSRQVYSHVIDFGVGQPAPHTLPLSIVQAAAQHRLTPQVCDPSKEVCDPTLLLQYGTARGYPSFRAALAKLLTHRYMCEVHGEELMVTAGVSHGLDLACRHLSRPGDVVVMESPTYFLAAPIMKQNGLVQLACHADEHGLDTHHLEQLLSSGQHKVSLVYCIPIHHNPRGTTLSFARRQHLVQLAHKYGFYVIADEVYQLLSFQDPCSKGTGNPGTGSNTAHSMTSSTLGTSTQKGLDATAGNGLGGAGSTAQCGVNPPSSATCPVMPLRWHEQQLLASQGVAAEAGAGSRVISLGSFSKIMAPGLRLGWIEAGPEVLSVLALDGTIHSGGSLQLASGIVHSALELDLLGPHIDKVVRPHLSKACDALCDALAKELPHARFHRPKGGYFVWVDLGPGVDTQELLAFSDSLSKQQLAAVGNKVDLMDSSCAVRFMPGAVCGGGEAARSCVRLCFAFYRPAEMREGVRRLAALILRYTSLKASGNTAVHGGGVVTG